MMATQERIKLPPCRRCVGGVLVNDGDGGLVCILCAGQHDIHGNLLTGRDPFEEGITPKMMRRDFRRL
jgi:hypothetical protein